MLGICYRLAEQFWLDYIPSTNDRPIKYCEIGVCNGFNIVSVEKYYAKHPDSKLYAIDPWEDYNEYPQYKGEQEQNYYNYLHNINLCNIQSKVITIRNKSENALPKFEVNFFDIMYIDGSHEYEFVKKDCILSLPKVKSGGYIIFDDVGISENDLIRKAIDEIFGNSKEVELIKDIREHQRIYRKL
jgi:hypothetical protein